MATINDLVPRTLSRIDEINQSGPVFWLEQEVTSAIAEAECDLMLLAGRPDLSINVPFTIQPNQWLQTMPSSIFALTNIQGQSSEVWKVVLSDMDGQQVSGPDWEMDVGDIILRWFPIGFGFFGVWPVLSQEQAVLLTGIASTITDEWPYSGLEAVPFHEEFFQAIEKYAAHYLTMKEGGNSFAESNRVYQSYLQDAKRMTQIEDRRDPYIFSGSVGAQTVTNPAKLR